MSNKEKGIIQQLKEANPWVNEIDLCDKSIPVSKEEFYKK